jgi:hypothetical protein
MPCALSLSASSWLCLSPRLWRRRPRIHKAVHRDPAPEHGQEKWRACGWGLRDLRARAQDDVHRWKAVGDELAGAAQVRRRLAFEVGDDEKIDIAAGLGGSLGVRAEEDDALGGEGPNQAFDRAVKNGELLHGFQFRPPAPLA